MIKVDKEKCIGCGNCEATCPKVFQLKNGKSTVKKGQENSKAECVLEAIDGCPTGAISR